jgi:hypothetical protein
LSPGELQYEDDEEESRIRLLPDHQFCQAQIQIDLGSNYPDLARSSIKAHLAV